jgi:V8-like Glu-specific endopeptidase
LPQPAAFGTNNRPFTAARADGATVATNTSYPWRAAGRLFATIGGGSGTCSASLIKRGLVVTAAHCVSNFGTGQIYTSIRYVPGYRNGQAPYGTWAAARVWVLPSYLNGTDQCSQRGVVCRNDVAVLTLAPQGGRYPGTSTGWFGYGWNGNGFTGAGLTHITQLGYPSCLDNGNFMERNDAQGSVSASMAGNTVIGSLMCPGSSGGPWLINFGLPSALTGTTSGAQASANFVVGTTSWVSSNAVKDMGASPFTNTNIVALVNAACAATPAACAP